MIYGVDASGLGRVDLTIDPPGLSPDHDPSGAPLTTTTPAAAAGSGCPPKPFPWFEVLLAVGGALLVGYWLGEDRGAPRGPFG